MAHTTPLATAGVNTPLPTPLLPPELVARVLELTLPQNEGPNLAKAWKGRSSGLRTFCLLSSGWKEWAMARLLERVHLPTSIAATAFADLPVENMDLVKMLLVGGDQWEEARAFGFERLRGHTPHLRSLEVAELEALPLDVVLAWPGQLPFTSKTQRESDLRPAPELRRLALRGLRVHTPTASKPPLLHSPHLTSLHLSCIEISEKHLSDLLRPTNLPSLTTLALHSVHLAPNALQAISPQIQLLSLMSQELHCDNSGTNSWSSLAAYNSGWGMGVVATLRALDSPAPVRFLRIEQAQQDLEMDLVTVATGIEHGAPWIAGLEQLWLEQLDPLIYQGKSDPAQFAVNIARVRAQGVGVFMKDHGCFENWSNEVKARVSTAVSVRCRRRLTPEFLSSVPIESNRTISYSMLINC